jgi:pimeloyl-ACP methyl ester carboxylesterase
VSAPVRAVSTGKGNIMRAVLPKPIIAFLFVICAAAVASGAQDVTGAGKRTIDVAGVRLQVVEIGDGAPAVIFVAGMGEDLSTWGKVQPLVAQFSQTLSYDRAGLGGSGPASGPRTVSVMVEELHALLSKSGHAAPYVLVGHSLGGAVVVEFARRHRTEVAGLVLVDPEDQRLLDALKDRLPAKLWSDRQAALAREMPTLPPAVRAEMEGMAASGDLAGGYRTDLPTVLLSGTKKNPQFPGNPLEQDVKLEIQLADLKEMSHSRHVAVPESRHYVQNDAPEKVVAAIREVVEESRVR